MQETQVRSLGWEDPLEKGMTTCSSVLAWRIPWTEEPVWGCKRVVHDFATKQQDFTHVKLRDYLRVRTVGAVSTVSDRKLWQSGV